MACCHYRSFPPMVQKFGTGSAHLNPDWGGTACRWRSAPRLLRSTLRFRDFQEMPMRHVLSALVQNQPGVLAHVSGMLASRGFNIDSLAVGETEDPNLSRMTFVVHGDDTVLDQVRKQLDKLITVVRVQDISGEDFVERDLMLLKVTASPEKRMEISLLVEMFRARVVDVSPGDLMIEISGQERKIEAFIELMRPYGIQELARTGRIALVRGTSKTGDVS